MGSEAGIRHMKRWLVPPQEREDGGGGRNRSGGGSSPSQDRWDPEPLPHRKEEGGEQAGRRALGCVLRAPAPRARSVSRPA